MIQINRNFVGDRYANTGIWGLPTSYDNFCEEDYIVTRYIAEFINSWTNLAYEEKHLRRRIGTESSIVFYWGYVFSYIIRPWKSWTQVCDELSMFWIAGALLIRLVTFDEVSRRNRLLSAGGIVTLLLAVSIIHASPFGARVVWLHSTTFAMFVWSIGARVRFLVRNRVSAGKGTRRSIMADFWAGFFCMLVGFSLWVIDCAFCGELRQFRKQIGLPWAWVLELHGWWHILTAIGAGKFVVLVREVTNMAKLEKQRKEI